MAREEQYLDFGFTIKRLPEGQALTTDEIERMHLQKLEETGGTSKEALWNLVVLYSRTNRQAQAVECVKKFAAMAGGQDEEASCWLAMGQLAEQVCDFDSAVVYYRQAREMDAGNVETRYFIHNNLGYSLIQLGRPKEAAPLLQTAIAIDGTRPNAFKNLGLAHRDQGEIAEAADYFVLATQANAADARSLKHLEELIEKYPDILLAMPGLAETLDFCRKAVKHAASFQPDFKEHWTRLRKRPRKRR